MDRNSYMTAIPQNEEEIKDPEGILSRIRAIQGLTLIKADLEDEKLTLETMYDNMLYEVSIYPMEFGELPPFFRIQHVLTDAEAAELESRNVGLCVYMPFVGDALSSYHFQLKLIYAACSGVLAVIDESAEKIISGRWVTLAAASNVAPAPRYLFTVQAVSDGVGEVWLHSHGLNRCGVTELEILGSTQENYGEHYNIIETMAKRLLELEKPLVPEEPMFLARLSADVALVTALLPWQDALKFYDESILGGSVDRVDGHNGETSCIFAYASEQDYERGTLSLVSVFDEILAENPIYMLSTRETERMKALALERLPYLKRCVGDPDGKILIKLGIPVDEAEDSGDNREHMWFELREISDASLVAELVNEPYYVKNLKMGDVGEYPIFMITDWMIFLPEQRITPDDVYLLE